MTIRARLLSASLLALALAVIAGAPAAAAPASRTLTLRLTDLAPGYSVPFRRCRPSSALADENPLRKRSCTIEFARAWTPPGTVPGPATVISSATAFRNTTEAEAALRHPGAFASLAFDTSLDASKVLEPPSGIGDAAVLLRGFDGSAIVMWRSGTVLAALLAGHGLHGHGEVDTQAVLDLAALQQARIATPTPLRPADNDGTEVVLDDPALGVPVYWLGRRTAARSRRPVLVLSAVDDLMSDPPQPLATLSYAVRGTTSVAELALWKPRTIRRELSVPRLRRQFCVRKFPVDLGDNAHGTVIGTYERHGMRCGRRSSTGYDYVGIGVFRGVAVTVDASDCCTASRPAPYDSPAGLRTILRALHPRELRSVTPTP